MMTDPDAVGEDDEKESPKPVTAPVNKKSKKIRKDSADSTDAYWFNYNQNHPEKAKECHYLRELIRGKEYELKYLRLRLARKSAKHMSNPTSLAK